MNIAKRISIIGIGNKLMHDEGVGIHAIEHLRELKWPENISILDGGTGGITLLHLLEDCDHAIIIDAAGFGGAPGDVKAFNLEDVNLGTDSAQVSLHGTSFAGIIALANSLGQKLPKITIVAIQPKEIKPSMELSSECQNALPKCIALIRSIF